MKLCNLLFVVISTTLISPCCKKQDEWLDKKRQLNDVEPSTLADFQAIMDDPSTFNFAGLMLGQVGTDNYYLTDANILSVGAVERNAYKWAKDVFEGQQAGDWNDGYKMVGYCNIILDGLKKIEVSPANQEPFNTVKGSALFYRSLAFYGLSQIFCKPYVNATADTDLGIPVRLTPDVNVRSHRASVRQVYDQIINDLKDAIILLPGTPLFNSRPSRSSANALLAKLYLSIGDYNNAYTYSNNALAINNTLIDYNNFKATTSTAVFPAFATGNPEIIFYAYGNAYYYSTVLPSATGGKGYIDSVLYRSYDNNDLRKTLFFQDFGGGRIQIRGTYSGTWYNFTGIANNEVYLIRAEASARLGNVQPAMDDLNTLLGNRYVNGTFTNLTAADATDALTKILRERRKELPFVGQLRWEDLRRLNNDSRFSTTLTRVIAGITYKLQPNDLRYVYPIPDIEIQLSGISQNPR